MPSNTPEESNTSTPSITFTVMLDDEIASRLAIEALAEAVTDAIQDIAFDSGIALMDMCEEDKTHGPFVPVEVSVHGICAECAEALDEAEPVLKWYWGEDLLDFEQVQVRIDDAFDEIGASQPAAVCWDGCHKIYVLKDEAQIEHMRSLGYSQFVFAEPYSSEASRMPMMAVLREWYDKACPLVFISGVGPDWETFIPQLISNEAEAA